LDGCTYDTWVSEVAVGGSICACANMSADHDAMRLRKSLLLERLMGLGLYDKPLLVGVVVPLPLLLVDPVTSTHAHTHTHTHTHTQTHTYHP
jgi:hypothetical protein